MPSIILDLDLTLNYAGDEAQSTQPRKRDLDKSTKKECLVEFDSSVTL